jgi:hypothetical protein
LVLLTGEGATGLGVDVGGEFVTGLLLGETLECLFGGFVIAMSVSLLFDF